MFLFDMVGDPLTIIAKESAIRTEQCSRNVGMQKGIILERCWCHTCSLLHDYSDNAFMDLGTRDIRSRYKNTEKKIASPIHSMIPFMIFTTSSCVG